jgi:hypothetical protein
MRRVGCAVVQFITAAARRGEDSVAMPDARRQVRVGDEMDDLATIPSHPIGRAVV